MPTVSVWAYNPKSVSVGMLPFYVPNVNAQHGCFAALLLPENNGPLLTSYQGQTALDNPSTTGNPGNEPVVDLVHDRLASRFYGWAA